MASSSSLKIFLLIVALALGSANAQLSWDFYESSCPDLQDIVREVMTDTVFGERRMGASILRLHFHDCFVHGCDGSVLLDDTRTVIGEKGAAPNRNSARGFEVIDEIKTQVEAACPNIVSCADILAIAARDGVELVVGRTTLGSSTWEKRRSQPRNTSRSQCEYPSPFSDFAALVRSFAAKRFSARDMVILSGGHNIGFAQCSNFRSRIYNESSINATYAAGLRANCPRTGGDSNLAPLDVPSSVFDNNYYKNLVNHRGLLHSDQQIYNGVSTDSIVQHFANDGAAFRRAFSETMVRLGNLSPLTGTAGEIRRNCRRHN